MTKEINKHLSANMTMSKKQIMVANFLGGLSWGLGTVIGASVIVGLIVTILRLFNFIPGLEDLLKQIPVEPK